MAILACLWWLCFRRPVPRICPGCCACRRRMLRRSDVMRQNRPRGRAARDLIGRVADRLVAKGAWICGSLIITRTEESQGGIHDRGRHCDGSGTIPQGQRGP